MQEGGVWLASQIFHNDLKLYFSLFSSQMKNGQSSWACSLLPLHTNTCFGRDGELMEALIQPGADTDALCCNRRGYYKAVAGAVFFYPKSGCSAGTIFFYPKFGCSAGVVTTPSGLVQQQLVQGAGAPAGLQRAEKLGTAFQGPTKSFLLNRTDSLLPSALRLHHRDKNLASLLPPRGFSLEL